MHKMMSVLVAGVLGLSAAVGFAADTKPVEAKPVEVKPAGKSLSKQRMTFKDKHALETLPGRIDQLSEEARRLHAVLDDPGLYARDPKLFAATTEKLTATEAALAAAEEEWLRLEMLREELGG